MALLGYPVGPDQWIWLYHLVMSDWNKELIAKTFKINKSKNIEYTIFIATNAYGIGIDNLDIQLVI